MTPTSRPIHDLIRAACMSPNAASPEILLYWDVQDPANPGPAYRTATDSGPCELMHWNGSSQGMHLEDFFRGPDGAYLGPDSDGVYPILIPS